MRIKKLLPLCLPLLFVAVTAHAGLFSRAQTEGQRLDDAKPVVVDSVQVYSFLQEGAGNDSRLAKGINNYLGVVSDTLTAKGVQVDAKQMPVGTLTMDATPLGVRGEAGFKRELDTSSKVDASEIAREHSDGGAAGYRLLLLPDTVIRDSGLRWGSRAIQTGAGTVFSRGAVPSTVPSYRFRVYWLLEDAEDKPIAAGTTTGILDIRGFPAKTMAVQMTAELERLGISWKQGTTE